jgi:predicted Zn-dependent protease
MRRDHLAFLLGGLAFGILIGFALFKAVATRPGAVTSESSSEIPAPAGPAAPTQTLGEAPAGGEGAAGGGGAPMMAEINALKERVKANPADAEAWTRLGSLYQQAGMAEQAVEFYERAVAIRPDDAALLNELGICYQAARRLEPALASFQKAQKADPQSWEAIYNSIITEAALKRFDAARTDLARLRKLKPDAPSLDQLEAAVSQVEKESGASPPP